MLYIDFFEKGVARFPNREIIREDERALTYSEMDSLVSRIASALIEGGMKPDSKIAIYSPNHIYGFAVQYGILRAGCIWVPVNFRLTAADAQDMLTSLDADWLFFHSSLASEVKAIRDDLPRVKRLVCFDEETDFAVSFDRWVDGAKSLAEFPRRTPGDTAAFLSTSGTTGRSKGIVLSNRAFATMIAGFDKVLRHDEPPLHLIVAPLSHAAGIYGSCLLTHGGTNILLPHSDPASILRAIDRHKITTLFLPPTLIYMLLSQSDVRKGDYSSLSSMLYGAAPMAEHKLREAIDIFGPVLTQLYGQSEALMMICFMSAQDHVEALKTPEAATRLFSAGREGPMVRVEIMDDGKVLPQGQQGEVVLRGEIVMDRYYKDVAATAEAQADGWHHTGDIGYRDKDGFIFIVDRKKEIIISGGFNIYPREVEQVVLAYEGVQDCAVVGIPDEKWGEAVMAAIEVRPGGKVDIPGLLAHCRAGLGGMKTPKSITIVDTLPRSSVGKVLRREVRAPYWVGHARKV